MLIQLWHAPNLKPKQMTMSCSRANQHREPIRVSSNLSPSWARLEGAHPWAEEAPVSSSLLDRMAEGSRWWVGDWCEEKQELSGLLCSKTEPESCLLFFFLLFFAVKDPKFLPYQKPPRSKARLANRPNSAEGPVNCWACMILQYWWDENQQCLWSSGGRGGAGPGVRECNK